jgi:hypothetical protein
MRRLLQFLWSGCWHEWVIIKEKTLEWEGEFGGTGICSRYILQCKKCGDLRKYDGK